MAVIDRFHVMKNLNDALGKTRRQAQKKLAEVELQGQKGLRWLLGHNHDDLIDEPRQQLDAMLAYTPELTTCCDSKDSFHALPSADMTLEVALAKLDE